MKRMRILVLLIGLAGCCWLVWRHNRNMEISNAAQDQRAFDAWQKSIKLDTRTNYDSVTKPTPPELAAEETRQRPEEGRN